MASGWDKPKKKERKTRTAAHKYICMQEINWWEGLSWTELESLSLFRNHSACNLNQWIQRNCPLYWQWKKLISCQDPHTHTHRHTHKPETFRTVKSIHHRTVCVLVGIFLDKVFNPRELCDAAQRSAVQCSAAIECSVSSTTTNRRQGKIGGPQMVEL